MKRRSETRMLVFFFLAVANFLSWLAVAVPHATAQAVSPTQPTLKILTHNVWYGFTKKTEPRHARWLAWMKEQAADIVVQQELNEYTPARLAQEAATWGHPYSELLKEDGFATGITSRFPLTDVERLRDGFHHGLLRCRVQGLWVYVIHFHPSHFARRIEEARLLAEDIRSLPEAEPRIVLAGDFNGFSPIDQAHYDQDEQLVPFFQMLDQRDPNARNLNAGKMDYGGIDAIQGQGFIDTVAHFRNPKASFAGTFPTRLVSDEDHGSDRRLDYIFVSPNLLPHVQRAEILRNETTELLSDHVPVTATIDLNMPRIEIDQARRGFKLQGTKTAFTPWGFNYDHDRHGRLIEDYWHDEWATVEEDFREMKALGANVVRVHLQFGKFMASASQPDAKSLGQLKKLIRLAEDTGLYLDLTGLGCYHKQDVPDWYDQLTQAERWQTQAVFWQAIAKTCATSSAIFCYDLMNEPVVPGGTGRRDDWLGAAFGDKHFVQFIALETGGQPRPEIAAEWIAGLADAIRQEDTQSLITVGLVPWSLDRPGLTSGFPPDKVSERLDFISVHLYPEQGKLEEALETLQGFAAVGKPVVIEEMFNLQCDGPTLASFIERSSDQATGWIGFYWGQTAEEYDPPSTIPDAMMLAWLKIFQSQRPKP
ncbi:MAG: cellulase family glycosylhydrolase [Planctomycetaceae bacterium]|nr:cellulase family glycosylhydrolase [Planctomycetaceae bacterium]